MLDFRFLADSIHGGDPLVYQKAKERCDGLAKPLGSLGELETAICRMAALTGSPDVSLDRRSLFVFCADNGVVAQGVSQSDASVTEAVARALGEKRSTVNYLASGLNCKVIPVDIGMSCKRTPPGVLDRRVRGGTADLSSGPAMEREDCIRAIEAGFALAEEAVDQGADILLSGEMGIGNTTTSTAVLSVLLNRPPEVITGKGAGLSDTGLKCKIEVIRRGIAVNHPDPEDPVDVLIKVGGLDLAALCGFYLGAAYSRRPVLLDGLITYAAALCAVRLCPGAGDVLLASHCSAEPASRLALDALGLSPLISAGLRLGEGSGAVAALPLLDMALRVYHSGNRFASIGIEPYQPL